LRSRKARVENAERLCVAELNAVVIKGAFCFFVQRKTWHLPLRSLLSNEKIAPCKCLACRALFTVQKAIFASPIPKRDFSFIRDCVPDNSALTAEVAIVANGATIAEFWSVFLFTIERFYH